MEQRRPHLPSQPASAFQLHLSTSVAPPRRDAASAPIPSPNTQHTPFFATFAPPSAGQTQVAQQPQAQGQQQSAQPSTFQYNPDRTGAGATAQETSSFIRDYALVAEAAKRAQMAVLMRDLEGVELQ